MQAGNLSEVLEHSPIILGPGIVLALYFLTLELTRNEKIALIAAFLGAVSFHTLAGIYAGFYANWLALIVGYISIVFLFRYLRSGRPSDIVVFSILLIASFIFPCIYMDNTGSSCRHFPPNHVSLYRTREEETTTTIIISLTEG